MAHRDTPRLLQRSLRRRVRLVRRRVRSSAVCAVVVAGVAVTACSMSETIDASDYRAARGVDPLDAPGAVDGVIVDFVDLRVGHCVSFDSDSGDRVTGLLVVSCSQSHNHEVTLNEPIERFGDEFPGDAEMNRFAEARCARAFRAYVGVRAAGDPDLTWVWFAPDEGLWGGRDRTLQCLVESETMIRSTLRA